LGKTSAARFRVRNQQKKRKNSSKNSLPSRRLPYDPCENRGECEQNVAGVEYSTYIQPKRDAYFMGRRASLDCFLVLPVGIVLRLEARPSIMELNGATLC
jgi:hypothetical protein